jgi:hypothetical protein
MTSPTAENLGKRLERERVRRFVGRAAELELFSSWLEASSSRDAEPNGQEVFNVLWVYGPGGIGKSTLLRAFAEIARSAGFLLAQIDGGRVMPTADGVRSAVWESLSAGIDADGGLGSGHLSAKPSVIIFDAAERLQPVEAWLREEFLPALPDETRVIIAGRRPPDVAWRSDPGWRELLRVMALRNLSPDQIRALLEIEGISTDLLAQMMALTHGHPLAVSLLIDAVRRSGPGIDVPESLQDLPDVVTALLNRIVEHAPTNRHRAALQLSAHASVTAEPLLRVALPAEPDEASALWEWLRGLTIMEESQAGVFPHDVARDVLEFDLRQRDPDTYADIHRRLRGYLVDQVKAAAGNPDALQQAVADLLFLIRDHPVAGAYWYWDALEGCPGRPVQPEQFDVIIAMTRDTQGEQQAELAAHWLRRQPEAFRVFEGPDGEIGGYAARLALHLARSEDINADPGAAALWRYAEQHHRPRPGELVLGWRFVVDRDPDERHPRLAGTMFGAWHVIDILLRGPTAWEFDACYTDLDYWERFFNHFDFVYVPDADYQIGSDRYVAFAHDWRRVGVADWLERTAARELGEQVAISAPEPAAMLSQEEFAASVKEALRSFHQPQALLRNPLMASSMVQTTLRGHPDDRPDQVLRGLILDAAQVVKSDPRAEVQYRVLDRTYLRPAPSQEKAAELLDLPFSTYRRYRDRGTEAITDWLWEHDIESTSHG